MLDLLACGSAGSGGQDHLSRQATEWWRWIRVSVQDISNHIQPWRSLANVSGGNSSRQHQQQARLRLLAEWDPDIIEWYGDYRLNNAEWARSRGVVVCHAGEFEYEEGPLVVNLLDTRTPNIVTDVWRGNGLALDIDGHPPPSSADGAPPGGISRPYMTHGAPLWHLSVMQGVARQGLFADAIVQDNAVGSVGRVWQGCGFSPVEQRRFASFAGMPRNFSIALYVKHAMSRGLKGETLIVDPVVQNYIIWLYTVWRDAWKDIATLTKQVAREAGRSPPGLYGNIGNDNHPNMGIAESPWHDRLFIENEGWQSFPDHGCRQVNVSGRPYCDYRRADGEPPDALTTLANKLLQAAAPGKPTISYGYPSTAATMALWLAETTAINSVAGQQDYQLADKTDKQCPVLSCTGMRQVSNEHVRFTQANRHLLEDRRRIADTAVVYCFACTMWRQVHAVISDGVSTSHLLYFKAVSTLMERTQRAWEPYLLDYQVVWSRPANDSLTRPLASYSQVILPAIDALSDRDVAELSAFVRAGGRLVLVHNRGDVPQTGLKTEKLQPRVVPALQALRRSPGDGRIDIIDTDVFSDYISGKTGAFAKVSALFAEVSPPGTRAVSMQGAPASLWMNAYTHGVNSMTTVHLVNYSVPHAMIPPLEETHPDVPVVLHLNETFESAWWFTRNEPQGQMLNTSISASGGSSVSLPQVPVYGIVAFGTRSQVELRASAAVARKWLERLLIADRSYALQTRLTSRRNSSVAQLLRQADTLLLTVQGSKATMVTDTEAARLTVRLNGLATLLKQALSATTTEVQNVQEALRDEQTVDLCTTEAKCVVGINFCGNTVCSGTATPGFEDVTMTNLSYLPRRGFGFTSTTHDISVLTSDTETEPADSLHRTAWKSTAPAKYRIDLPNPGSYVVTVMSGSQDPSGDQHLGSSYAGYGEATSQWVVFSSTAIRARTQNNSRGGLLAAQGLSSGYFLCRSFAVNATEGLIELEIGSSDGGATGLNYGANTVLWMLNAITVHRASGPLPSLIQRGLDHSERLRRLICRDFWWVGPFDASSGLGLETAYPPEQAVPSATVIPHQTFSGKNQTTVRWQRWQAGLNDAPAALNFGRLLLNTSIRGAVAFAWTRVMLNKSRRVNIWSSASGSSRIWTISQHQSPTKRLVWSGALSTGMDDASVTGAVARDVVLPAGPTIILMKSVHTFNGDYNVGKGGIGNSPAEWAAWLGVELSDLGQGNGDGSIVECSGDVQR